MNLDIRRREARSLRRFSQLLEVLVSSGQLEAEKFKLEPRLLDLALFCCDLVAQIQLMSNNSQHTITFVSRGKCSSAHVDKKMLQSMLTNLLENAVFSWKPDGKDAEPLDCRAPDGSSVFFAFAD